MPIAPIISPGSSLAASANVIRNGTLMVNLYTPAYVQVNEDVDATTANIPSSYSVYLSGDTNAATIATANMPTIFFHFRVLPGYYDTTNGPVAPLNCVSALPLIVNKNFGYGTPLCQPIQLFPGSSSFFSCRAPLEKIGFRLYCSGYPTPPILGGLPLPPDSLFGMPALDLAPPIPPWPIPPAPQPTPDAETFTMIEYYISVSQ